MKLRGISLVVPVADLRPLCVPRSRFHFISPYAAKIKKTHLRGLGVAKGRKLRIPWRDSETIFFECDGAISLPKQLPDGASVAKTVRRVYVDDGPTIRFDLSLFAHPSHRERSSEGDLSSWIKSFWDESFQFRDHGAVKAVKCPEAFKRLARKLVSVSGPTSEARNDLVEVLSPLLIVIVEAHDNDLEKLGRPIDAQQTLFSAFQRFSLPRHTEKVMGLLIAHPPGLYLRPWDPGSDPLRYARLFPSWLHSDLEVLHSLTKRIENSPADQALKHVVVPHLKRVINSFGNIVAFSGERGLSIEAFGEVYQGTVAAIVNALKQLKLDDAAGMLKSVFEPEHPVAKLPSDLDPLLDQGLTMFADWLTKGRLEDARYDDQAFHTSAIRKANEVAKRIPPKGPYVIVSIGGADATELFTLGSLIGSSKGVLLEKSAKSVEDAKKRKPSNFEFVGIVGDAMGGIAEAMKAAKSLSADSGGCPILVTIMAVLHELLTRSAGFDLVSFLSKLREAAVIIGREPIEPSNWNDKVFLSGNFTAEKFCRFANGVVVPHYLKLISDRGLSLPNLGQVEEIEKNTVRGARGIVVETLVKAFYVQDLFYEVNELFTGLTEEKMGWALNRCFAHTHSPVWGSTLSESMKDYWQRYELRAENTGLGRVGPAGPPGSHLWYEATRKDFQ